MKMFIIEGTNTLINFANIEMIEVVENELTSQVIARGFKNDYIIYENVDNDMAWQAYSYICQAIEEGYKSIVIQNTSDNVEVYKDPDIVKTWGLIL